MKPFWQITAISLFASVLCAQTPGPPTRAAVARGGVEAPGPPTSAAVAPPDVTKPSSAAFHIAGTVVDQTGQPVTGIVVAVAPALKPEDPPVTVTTGENGRFRFEGLHAGKYNLGAQRGGEVQGYDAHGEFSTAIAIGPGLDPGDLIFRLRPRSTISGKVTDEHNEPVRGAMVKLYSREDGTSAFTSPTQTSTDDQGIFRFGHLAPGRYCLLVLAQAWYADALGSSVDDDSEQASAERPLNVVYPATYYPGGATPNTESPIVLGTGDRVTADISLQPVPALSVRLPAPGSDGENPVSVSMDQYLLGGESEDLSPRVRQVSPGVVELSGIRPGNFEAAITVVNPQLDESERRTIHRKVDLSPNGEATFEEEQAAIRIQGSARQDNGAPLPKDAMLLLRNLETHRMAGAVVSPDGQFQFEEDLAPGRYELTSATKGLFISSIRTGGARLKGSTIQVGGGASTPPPAEAARVGGAGAAVSLAVTLTQGVGRVNGTALKDGKPLAGAMIVLVPTDAANNFSLFRRDQSDSDGSFTLRDALTGKYTVLALENGWDLEWSNPEVLKPFMAGGTAVQVHSKETLDVKVNVQAVDGAQ